MGLDKSRGFTVSSSLHSYHPFPGRGGSFGGGGRGGGKLLIDGASLQSTR